MAAKFVRSLVRSFSFLQNIPKTIYINFKALRFCQARHFPIYCGNRVSLHRLKKGSIQISGKISRGMVTIGLNGARGSGLGGIKNKYSQISFSEGAKLVFNGKCHLATGIAIKLTKNSQLEIGANFSTNVLCYFNVFKRVEIGEDCFFGWNVSVRDGDGHYIIDAETGAKLNEPKEIKIGNHVWLCSDSTIMKGVCIADDCVVACNALVTKTCNEPHAIYGGCPAKLIKAGISFIKDGHEYGQ